MSQNKQIILRVFEPDFSGSAGTFGLTEVGGITLQPLRSRLGVFEYAGSQVSGPSTGSITNTAKTTLSASVRQGRPSDFVKKVPRVKRKSIIRANLPILVPGPDGDVVDYITVDFSISAPVEANELQLCTALALATSATFDKGADGATGNPATPLKDLVLNGNEPF